MSKSLDESRMPRLSDKLREQSNTVVEKIKKIIKRKK